MSQSPQNHDDHDGLTFEVVEDEHHESGQKTRHRGIYLLPNLFTTAALFSGFYAIIHAMGGHYESAAMAIFVAALFDGMDGRVARMTNTQSAFGAEFDSLSDMVSFGVAPALVVFSWALQSLGKFGWICAFIYCVAAAFRLARFNVQLEVASRTLLIDGAPLVLAQSRHAVLEALLRRRGAVVPRGDLMDISGAQSAGALEALISRLRRALKERGGYVRIAAACNSGYYIEATEANLYEAMAGHPSTMVAG